MMHRRPDNSVREDAGTSNDQVQNRLTAIEKDLKEGEANASVFGMLRKKKAASNVRESASGRRAGAVVETVKPDLERKPSGNVAVRKIALKGQDDA